MQPKSPESIKKDIQYYAPKNEMYKQALLLVETFLYSQLEERSYQNDAQISIWEERIAKDPNNFAGGSSKNQLAAAKKRRQTFYYILNKPLPNGKTETDRA